MGVYSTDNANWYGCGISQHCLENTIRVVINGGEINTKEEAQKFQHDASYTLYIIKKGGFSSHELTKSKKIFKLDEIVSKIREFRREEWLKNLDEKSYKEAVQEDNLKIMQKCHKIMKQKELDFISEKINFNTFLIYLESYERYREKLDCGFGKYYSNYGAETLFNKNGYYHPHKRPYLIEFVKEEKKEISSSSSLEVEEYIPPKELLEGDFRDLKIRDKVIWGIGPKAITLVDGVGYNKEYYYPRYPIGEKEFFNYKQKPVESKELAEEILDKYCYRE